MSLFIVLQLGVAIILNSFIIETKNPKRGPKFPRYHITTLVTTLVTTLSCLLTLYWAEKMNLFTHFCKVSLALRAEAYERE